MFIGYWTYSDYYTKINDEALLMYWIGTLGVYIISTELVILMFFLSNESIESLFTKYYHIIAYGTCIHYTLVLLYVISKLFEKSRNYFGQKRNKL